MGHLPCEIELAQEALESAWVPGQLGPDGLEGDARAKR